MQSLCRASIPANTEAFRWEDKGLSKENLLKQTGSTALTKGSWWISVSGLLICVKTGMSIQGWGAQCGRSCITSNQIFWSSRSMVTDGHCWEQTDEATVVLKCLWHSVLIEHSFRMKRNSVACFFLTLLYWLYLPHLDCCMPKKGLKVWFARRLEEVF